MSICCTSNRRKSTDASRASRLIAGALTLLLAAAGPLRAASPAPPQLLLMPASAVADPQFADGCWVRLYDGVQFRGSSLMLAGAVELQDMRATLQPWRDWDSAEIGPRARLLTFNAKGFREPAATLAPSQKLADLTSATGRFDDIESLRVQCLAQ